jgi:tetratricopeptide (TPR) repeat protein
MSLIALMIFTTISAAQTADIDKAKTEIAELMKNKASVLKTKDKNSPDYDKKFHYDWGSQKNIFVFDDRIEFRSKKESFIINYSDLSEYELYRTTDEKDNAGAVIGDFLIIFEGKVTGNKLVDDLRLIQGHNKRQADEKRYGKLDTFEPIAAKYRELKIKPVISEEQRKYIVQANSFNEQKNYVRAIALYLKAIEVDQTSYPAAYYNLAILSAQVNEFYGAIFYMKKYLMLEPEASDSRSAQDKIYVWEAQLDN